MQTFRAVLMLAAVLSIAACSSGPSEPCTQSFKPDTITVRDSQGNIHVDSIFVTVTFPGSRCK